MREREKNRHEKYCFFKIEKELSIGEMRHLLLLRVFSTQSE